MNPLLAAPLRLLIALSTTAVAAGQTPLFELHGNAAGDRYGTAVAAVGDVDADGVDDWAAGAPFDDLAGSDAGMVEVYSGATMQVLYTWRGAAAGEHFGTSVAGAEDLDGDGHAEVIVGAPGGGVARVFSGLTGLELYTIGPGGGTLFGQAVAGGGQLDGDGIPDLLVGEPWENAGGNLRGRMRLFSGATGSQIMRIDGDLFWGLFGSSLAFIGDVDGDLRDEFVVGAPGDFGWSKVRAFDGATGRELWADSGFGNSAQHGFSVASIADLTGDGIRDVLVGAPEDPGPGCGNCKGFGYVRALDGATGAQIYQITGMKAAFVGFGWTIAVVGDLDGNGYEDFAASLPGTPGCGSGGFDVEVRDGQSGDLLLRVPIPAGEDSLGSSLAFSDTNGDGLGDLICGAACASAGAGNEGGVFVYTLVRDVVSYCAAKVNSQGCTPLIEGFGTPSATVAQPFRIKAQQVLNNKSGLLFYGFAPQATPFQGGTMCVQASTKRTAVQASGGNPPPNDCSGFYSYDFNQRIRSGTDPALVAGVQVYGQYWSLDPSSPSTTGLTNALAFYINP